MCFLNLFLGCVHTCLSLKDWKIPSESMFEYTVVEVQPEFLKLGLVLIQTWLSDGPRPVNHKVHWLISPVATHHLIGPELPEMLPDGSTPIFLVPKTGAVLSVGGGGPAWGTATLLPPQEGTHPQGHLQLCSCLQLSANQKAH